MILVRSHDPFAKLALVQALLKHACRISPSDLGFFHVELPRGPQARKPTVVNTHGECQAGRIVADNVDGPLGDVEAGHDAVEVNKR